MKLVDLQPELGGEILAHIHASLAGLAFVESDFNHWALNVILSGQTFTLN